MKGPGTVPHRVTTAFSVLFLLVVCGRLASAETRYVTDRLIITLRQGPAPNATTIGTLKTDDPVEILEARDTFLRVMTTGGQEGWIASQYVTSQIPKTAIIKKLEEDNARLERSMRELEQEGAALKGSMISNNRELGLRLEETADRLEVRERELASMKKEFGKVSAGYDDLRKKSKHVIELSDERDRLAADNADLAGKLSIFRRENEDLRREGMIRWFLAGAGVFFVGWVAGKVSRKKKSYY